MTLSTYTNFKQSIHDNLPRCKTDFYVGQILNLNKDICLDDVKKEAYNICLKKVFIQFKNLKPNESQRFMQIFAFDVDDLIDIVDELIKLNIGKPTENAYMEIPSLVNT